MNVMRQTLNSSGNSQPLECLFKYMGFFSEICWQYPAKVSFMYQQWATTGHIFLKVPTTNSLLFFSKYFKNGYYDTSISNYL